MNGPTFLGPQAVAPDTHALTAYLPVPGFGVLPVNAFLIQGAQPTLVDTGLAALRQDFMAALRQLIDPAALRWIWLTHTDADHLGNLEAVLAEAPHARVVTSFLGMGKLGLQQLPLDRVYLINPGQGLNVGDRELVALRPPSFDAPETAGLFDAKTRAVYSADCFGALMDEPAEHAGAIAPSRLRDGLVGWSTVDSPWLHLVDEGRFAEALHGIRRLEPSVVLSSHLPPAEGMTETLLTHLASARLAPAFEGPDQAALDQMMRAAGDAA